MPSGSFLNSHKRFFCLAICMLACSTAVSCTGKAQTRFSLWVELTPPICSRIKLRLHIVLVVRVRAYFSFLELCIILVVCKYLIQFPAAVVPLQLPIPLRLRLRLGGHGALKDILLVTHTQNLPPIKIMNMFVVCVMKWRLYVLLLMSQLGGMGDKKSTFVKTISNKRNMHVLRSKVMFICSCKLRSRLNCATNKIK